MSHKRLIGLIAILVLVVVVGLGFILYALIDHGLDDSSAAAAATSTQSPSNTSAGVSVPMSSNVTTGDEDVSTDTGSLGTTGSTEVATSGSLESGNGYTTTDSTYESDTASISISQISTGSGKDTVTYFVADVWLASGTDLEAGLADGFERGNVDYTTAIAAESGAVFAVNGDYWTARDTGIIIRNGVLYLDNPARTGLAIYQDGRMELYDETEVSAEELLAAGVWNTYSFGPALIVDGVIPNGLDGVEVEDIGEEHTILGTQPRTAIGMVEAGHFVFVVVDGRQTGYSRGVTLSELAHIFQSLGCTSAYNLDGGGSSAMYFMGDLVNDPLGRGKERGISDVLMVGP